MTAETPGGAVDTGFVGTVNVTTSDPRAAGLPTSFNLTAASKGTHLFGVTFRTEQGRWK